MIRHTLRSFQAGEDPGYHNASLGTTGVAIPFPIGSQGALVSVSAGCYCGARSSATLATFSDDNYGSILNGAPVEVHRTGQTGDDYLHIAPWATTAIVAIAFF